MSAYTSKFLRSFFLPLLKATSFDFSLKHHWTGDPVRLNSFRHKGYWFHGKNREQETMHAFESMISPGDTVAEVGGHIGYLSLWFAKLVGQNGAVFVFEPGSNNLPYIRKNLHDRKNVTLVEKGCGAEQTVLDFYEDDLTGQNNSFVKDFQGLKGNSRRAPGVSVTVESKPVELCRLDSFLKEFGREASFVKIDTEGYEHLVLQGCEGLLTQKRPPVFMVEVQADESEILRIFTEGGYQLYNVRREQIKSTGEMRDNLFMLHPVHHAQELKNWMDRTPR